MSVCYYHGQTVLDNVRGADRLASAAGTPWDPLLG